MTERRTAKPRPSCWDGARARGGLQLGKKKRTISVHELTYLKVPTLPRKALTVTTASETAPYHMLSNLTYFGSAAVFFLVN